MTLLKCFYLYNYFIRRGSKRLSWQ